LQTCPYTPKGHNHFLNLDESIPSTLKHNGVPLAAVEVLAASDRLLRKPN
jgi:hypothetical protein